MKLFLAIAAALFAHALATALGGVASPCGEYLPPCRPPLSCVGNPGNMKCFKKKELGETCGKDPFWVCVDGLDCIDGICTNVVGKAEKCGIPYTVCEEPLSCVGNPRNMKCFKKKELGETCGKDPFWVCVDGLDCIDDICKNVVGKAEKCGIPYTVCEEPLSCVGNPRNMKCFKKKELGETCGKDPFWVCVDGLKCIEDICIYSDH